MEIQKVASLLEAKAYSDLENSHISIHSACGSDLMSDVMAFVKDQSLLLTGLINAQVIHTASLLDIEAVCIVRGKEPTQEMIQIASESNIMLLSTKLPMYLACGKLYEAGLIGGSIEERN